jgi:large subunit ribosomal protein L5
MTKGDTPMPRLKTKYNQEIKEALRKRFNYGNVMETPKLEKVVVNMGVGEAIQNPKSLDAAVSDLARITGQKPIITKAKRSIASFKLREGMSIGCKVTLRGNRMYEFVDKLLNATLPRVRDFRGVSPKSFDGRGNYTLGIKDQLIFPEIEYDKIDKLRGMDIVFVTSARSDEEGRELLRLLGMPFREA